jgi:manganese transport protein
MAPNLVLLAIGTNASYALVITQVVLSFVIPFTLSPLLIFCRNRGLMGGLVNHRLSTALPR